MECGSEFRELENHNPFIRELDELGYHVDFTNGHFVIFGLPYLDEQGGLKHGDWATPIDLKDSWVIDTPSDHQAYFRGGRPHDNNGRMLRLGGGANRITISESFIADQSFSLKLTESGQMRGYRTFEEKVRTYIDIITSPALKAYPEATPFRGIEVKAAAQGSPLRFPDTLSSRYQINDISSRLKGKKVAIVGLGGTGSYILDFISRTHVEKISLFDEDTIHVHTIFRIPGFISNALGRSKVEALAEQYSSWHGGIIPFSTRITAENIDLLSGHDFVFVSIDDGPSRLEIITWLTSHNIPFVDCGMGLNRSADGLNGAVRTTGVDRIAFKKTVGTCFLPTSRNAADEYRKQAQIAELNALNAAFAVIRFKQYFKLFERCDDYASNIFETASFEITTKEISE